MCLATRWFTNYVWTFTTADVTPPTVVSTVPVDNAVEVSVVSNISATFSEAMDVGTITTGTMTLHQGNTQIDGAVSYAGVTATFKSPTADLLSATVYTATITNRSQGCVWQRDNSTTMSGRSPPESHL